MDCYRFSGCMIRTFDVLIIEENMVERCNI